MNTFMKIMLVVLAILYCVSPIDALPGPIDDIVVVALAFAAQKKSMALED